MLIVSVVPPLKQQLGNAIYSVTKSLLLCCVPFKTTDKDASQESCTLRSASHIVKTHEGTRCLLHERIAPELWKLVITGQPSFEIRTFQLQEKTHYANTW